VFEFSCPRFCQFKDVFYGTLFYCPFVFIFIFVYVYTTTRLTEHQTYKVNSGVFFEVLFIFSKYVFWFICTIYGHSSSKTVVP